MAETNAPLDILPPWDSPEMAEARRRELNIPRERAAELGRTAVEAAEAGYYINDAGQKVDWSAQVRAACDASKSIPPDHPLPDGTAGGTFTTRVRVTNETTLGAARRLVDASMTPLALNFANGIHPGGGFLGGARAQEEVLCRSSALYSTLAGDPMYEAHRQRPRPDSTAWAILSPDVPVFRTDDGTPVDTPWPLSFITCAAPYAPAIGQPESADLMRARIRRVLEIARTYAYTELVLGAWGCGAFSNAPHRTAADFRNALETDFAGVFARVVFAVTDWSPERRFLGPFREVFTGHEEA